MNILVITQKPIAPINDGGKVAMNALFEDLKSTQNNFIYASICTPKHPNFEQNIPKDTFILKQNPNSIFNLIKTILLFGSKFPIMRFYSRKNAKSLNTIIDSSQIELVIFDGLYACAYLKLVNKKLINQKLVKSILRAHNIEHEIWNKSSSINSFLQRIFNYSLKKSEFEIFKTVNQIWTISDSDSELLNSVNLENHLLLPISFAKESFANFEIKKNSFFHLGAMDWLPNQESSNFIVDQIAEKFSDCQFVLGGKGISNFEFKNLPNNCILKDSIVDSDAFMYENGILLAPIFSGSGIRVKLLEAIQLGIPVITTLKGIQGIAFKKIPTVFLAESASDFIQQIAHVNLNFETIILQKNAGIEYIAANHSRIQNCKLIQNTFDTI